MKKDKIVNRFSNSWNFIVEHSLEVFSKNFINRIVLSLLILPGLIAPNNMVNPTVTSAKNYGAIDISENVNTIEGDLSPGDLCQTFNVNVLNPYLASETLEAKFCENPLAGGPGYGSLWIRSNATIAHVVKIRPDPGVDNLNPLAFISWGPGHWFLISENVTLDPGERILIRFSRFGDTDNEKFAAALANLDIIAYLMFDGNTPPPDLSKSDQMLQAALNIPYVGDLAKIILCADAFEKGVKEGVAECFEYIILLDLLSNTIAVSLNLLADTSVSGGDVKNAFRGVNVFEAISEIKNMIVEASHIYQDNDIWIIYPIDPENPPTPPTPCPDCFDEAIFSGYETLPEGTAVSPGESLQKTWRVKNTGTSTWDGYKLRFTDGEQMNGPSEIIIPTTAPGETVDISINLIAPETTGLHRGNWHIISNDGGWVSGGKLWVEIDVQQQSDNIVLYTDPASPASAGQVRIYARVKDFPNLRALRILVDGSQLCELGAPEFKDCVWHTSGYSIGKHPIVAEVDDWTGPSWDYPLRKTITFDFGGGGAVNHAPYRPILVANPAYDWYVTIGSTPQLCAKDQGDPDGNPVTQYRFVASASVGTVDSGWVSNSCHNFGAIKPGTYEWHAQVKDSLGGVSDWSDSWHFTVEPVGVEAYIDHFSPGSPSNAEEVKIFACTTGHAGVNITLRVMVNDANDGTDSGEWHIIKEQGSPCFNDIDVPVWRTLEYSDGPHLVRVVAMAIQPDAGDVYDTVYVLDRRRPASPRLIAPVPLSLDVNEPVYLNSRTINFQWEPAIRAESYTLHVSTDPSPADDPFPVYRETFGEQNNGTELVSVSSDGTQGNGRSGGGNDGPSISADGRYIAFYSTASNLVEGDTNNRWDIFVKDIQNGNISRVSISSAGSQGNGSSMNPSISANGRYVAFVSSSTNLVSEDANGFFGDIFVHDRLTGETTLVSKSSDGIQANHGSYSPSISADGRYVAYMSYADNLVPGDTNNVCDINGDDIFEENCFDIFVNDRQTGITKRVSVASDGTQGNGRSGATRIPVVISEDGSFVAFESDASNLVSDDTNNQMDVYIHEMATGQTTRISVASDGTQGNGFSAEPSISGDGRYVAFISTASNLVSNDTNNNLDVFVHDRFTGETSLVSMSSIGEQGNDVSGQPSISSDGRFVAFFSWATNLIDVDLNNSGDVFIHDMLTGETTLKSISSNGTQGNNVSEEPSISADGSYLAFLSGSSNLIDGDTNNFCDEFGSPGGELNCPDIFIHHNLEATSFQTTRVSVDSDGTEGNGTSRSNTSISDDGRFVAFHSSATNLDENGLGGVFVHDLQTGQTIRASVSSDGIPGSGSWPAISPDGRYVAFTSLNSNLVPGDINEFCDRNGDGVYNEDCWDVYLHDLLTGQTTLVSVTSESVIGNGDSGIYGLDVSAYGRYVAFSSHASNLVPNDSNNFCTFSGGQPWTNCTDIFVLDTESGVINRVSVALDGSEGNSASYAPAISADGRFIAFNSSANNLVPNDTNNQPDIFVHDRITGETEVVSVSSNGVIGNGSSDGPKMSVSISGDGRYVAFSSHAKNLVPEKTNNQSDIFVHDRLTGETERVSIASDGSEAIGGSQGIGGVSISSTGQYVAFFSFANNLVPNDTNQAEDVFVHDRLTGQTRLESVNSNGNQGNGEYNAYPSISTDGQTISFESDSSNLVPGDTNGVIDIFVHQSSGRTEGTVTFDLDYSTLYWQITTDNDAGINFSGAQRFGIDRITPTCTVQQLPSTTYNSVFQVNWSGSDNLSGIRSFDIQYMDSDRGTWENWLGEIPATRTYGLFTGQPGHMYLFRCRATDNAGNSNTYPDDADTFIIIDPSARPETPWWDDNYSNKRIITILNNVPEDSLPQGYPVHLQFNSNTTPSASELFIASQSDPKCDDLRILANDTIELNRVIPVCTADEISIWFRTEVEIPGGASNSSTHQLYYGNPTPAPPLANPNNVWYPFKEADTANLYFFQEGSGATAYDSSGFGRNCSINSSVEWSTAKWGKGLRFNKANYGDSVSLTCGSPSPLNSFTVEFWYKPDPEDSGRIAGQISPSGANWLLQIVSGRVRLDTWECSNCGSQDVRSEFSLRDPKYVGKWNHIAVTFNGGNEVKFYINGAHDSTKYLQDSGINTFNIPLEIGSAGGIGQVSAYMGAFRLSSSVKTSFPYGYFAAIQIEPTVTARDLILPEVTGNPDLVILSLETYPNPEGGEIVQVIVQNQGDASTINGFYTDLYVDNLPIGSGDYSGSLSFWINDPIGPGEIVSLTTVITDPIVINAMRSPTLKLVSLQSNTIEMSNVSENGGILYAQVDSLGVVSEPDDQNNIYSSGTPICIASPDSYENDDDFSASSLLLPENTQTHNIHRIGDQDWMKFDAEAGFAYQIQTFDLDISSDTYLYLYDKDGVTLLASNDDFEGSAASRIEWIAPDSGTYYIRVVHWNPNIGGCNTGYSIDLLLVEFNLPPTANAGGPYYNEFEGIPVSLDGSGSIDPEDNILLYEWDLDNDGEFDDATGVTTAVTFWENGTYTIGLKVTDGFDEADIDIATVTVNNVPPESAADVTNQNVQYSDYITEVILSAIDVIDDQLVATSTWSVDGGVYNPALPEGFVLSDNGCTTNGGLHTCTWTISGIAQMPAGEYSIRITIADDDGDQTEMNVLITVQPESAAIAFEDTNPVAVKVAEPGGNSGSFSLISFVTETQPDLPAGASAAGDISLAELSMSFVPVGPGGSVEGTCTPDGVSGSGYDAVLSVICEFDNVPVNTYTAQTIVDGGYYSGSGEDVLIVYDPSLGFTTGGGWFYWPGTNEKTNFGYTMKYNKKGTKVQGSLLMIRHLADGTKYRVKSNALYGLSLGEGEDFGWASFSGKSTYLEPGWLEPEGNHEFLVYVEDRNEPGNGIDHFWIQVYDKDRVVIDALSMIEPASDNAIELNGGNIFAPHGGGE